MKAAFRSLGAGRRAFPMRFTRGYGWLATFRRDRKVPSFARSAAEGGNLNHQAKRRQPQSNGQSLRSCGYPPMAYGSDVEFKRFRLFEKSCAGLFTEHDVFELELALVADPEAGDLIPGAKGLRKIRRPLAGRGKRGGAGSSTITSFPITKSCSSTSTPRTNRAT